MILYWIVRIANVNTLLQSNQTVLIPAQADQYKCGYSMQSPETPERLW